MLCEREGEREEKERRKSNAGNFQVSGYIGSLHTKTDTGSFQVDFQFFHLIFHYKQQALHIPQTLNPRSAGVKLRFSHQGL